MLNGEQLKPFLLSQEWDRLSAFSTPIQYSFRIPSQSNKTRARIKGDPNSEGRSQTIPICRWHDPIPKRLQKLYQKTTINHKLCQQSSRL
jgi:hypothetical protein